MGMVGKNKPQVLFITRGRFCAMHAGHGTDHVQDVVHQTCCWVGWAAGRVTPVMSQVTSGGTSGWQT
jgi:hypothetical protein